MVSGGEVIIYNEQNSEGFELNEPYLSDDIITVGAIDLELSDSEYFVRGDNRAASLDSRRVGPLPKKDLIGRAWLRGWPLDRIGILRHYSFDF